MSEIKFVKGDILKDKSEVLVNPVNRVGVMGKGLAKAFKLKFPEIEAPYKEWCKLGSGDFLLVQVSDCQWVLNFPTKNHWRDKSDFNDVKRLIRLLPSTLTQAGFSSAAIPPLGCGLGGLKWPDVRKEIIKEFTGSGVKINVYEQ